MKLALVDLFNVSAYYLPIRHPRKQYAFQIVLLIVVHQVVTKGTSIFKPIDLLAPPALPHLLSTIHFYLYFFAHFFKYFLIIATLSCCHAMFSRVRTTLLICQVTFDRRWF